MLRLASSSEARGRCAAAGRARALARFTQKSVVDETIAFYENVLAHPLRSRLADDPGAGARSGPGRARPLLEP